MSSLPQTPPVSSAVPEVTESEVSRPDDSMQTSSHEESGTSDVVSVSDSSDPEQTDEAELGDVSSEPQSDEESDHEEFLESVPQS